EGHLELVLQVLTATRSGATAATAPRPEEVAEQVAQDVLEARAEIEAAEASLLECRMAVAIVLRSPLGVAQDRVGLADLLEALLGLVIARVLVRVISQRELPVGLLQLLVAGRP